MPEGVLAPALRTDLMESSDLVTTLWLAGRGVYRSADDCYGRNGNAAAPLRTLERNLSVLTRFRPTNTDRVKWLPARPLSAVSSC